jgi:hypothetical protein
MNYQTKASYKNYMKICLGGEIICDLLLMLLNNNQLLYKETIRETFFNAFSNSGY